VKKTSEEWFKSNLLKGSLIIDPDGWDRQNWQFSWFEELITEKEFNYRVCDSTVEFSKEYTDSLVKGLVR